MSGWLVVALGQKGREKRKESKEERRRFGNSCDGGLTGRDDEMEKRNPIIMRRERRFTPIV